MDNQSQNLQSVSNSTVTDTTKELSHVTEEMYKKNFELAEKNKTLSLLRQIDEIILSKVADIKIIAQQVADVAAKEAEFKAVAIYLLDESKDRLISLALSETDFMKKIQSAVNKQFFAPVIYISDMNNYIASSIKEKTRKISHDEADILIPYFTEEEIKKIKDIDEIKSSLIYPLIVRDNVIGTLIISLGESEETLFQYQQDLVERLSGVVGIALDNALLYQRIQDANERLKSLDKLKDEFVSLASHELRTPMTSIKSYLWLLLNQKEELGKEKQKEYLERVYESTERLIKLVNDMLNVSRIESGRMTVNLKPTDILQLAADSIKDILPSAQNAQVAVNVVSPTSTLPQVNADPEKIKEVFINLIGNSLKFTPKGGKITISFFQKDGFVVANITDTGKGIKPEDMPKLFQKFGMVEGNYVAISSTQGTGLGLYLTKSIIELHGGNINVFSEGENKGTTFTFSLKIA